jgi:GR25 family glycosyltransferase involved in LPS biosynthesis
MNLINTFFDKIYLINLDKDKERLEYMMEFVENNSIENYIRVPGAQVDAPLSDIPEYVYRNFNKNEEKYIRGSIGCRLSHLSVINDAKINGYERILILEDDIKLVNDITLNDLLTNNLNYIQEFDMLYFGGLQEQMFRNQIVKSHCYAVGSGVYDDIINMAIPSGMEIDNFYAKILQHMSVNNRVGGKYIIKKIEPFNSVQQSTIYTSNIK